MTDQPRPAATWDVTATVTVAHEYGAHHARHALYEVIGAIAASTETTHTAVEMTRNDPAAGTYGQTLAREIIAELDAHDLAHQVASRTADYLHVMEQERARKQAADGLDDHDGPVTRAALYIERAGDRAIWAHHGGTWWYADPDIDDSGTAGWWQQRTGPLPASLRRLPGWVEIPQAAPGASEEQASA